jgi:NAD(P)-dependent dehydrogenase (short-subunit alcohol dehydrogenase family)
MTAPLEGRAAIVTGAGRGIGRGVAEALVSAGARVAIVDVDTDKAADAAGAIAESTGGDTIAISCDVSDRAAVEAMIAEVVEQFRALHVLVNNAQAVRPQLSLMEHTVGDVAIALGSGFWGTFHCMQVAFPHLRAVGDGRVINVGSAAGTLGMAGLGAYAAAKEAIRGLSRVAAREWGEFGITVNVFCPSSASPGMLAWAKEHPDEYQAAIATRAIRRDGDPVTDIGPLVVFLAGSGSGFITGETIMINGGNAMRP